MTLGRITTVELPRFAGEICVVHYTVYDRKVNHARVTINGVPVVLSREEMDAAWRAAEKDYAILGASIKGRNTDD